MSPFRVLPHTSQRLRTWGFPRGGHGCPDDSPVGHLQPVARFLCIDHPGGDTSPPHPCWLPNGRPAVAYPTTMCHGSSRLPPITPPPRHWRPCPPWRPLPPRRLLTGPRGDPYPRGPSAVLFWPGSSWHCGRPTSSYDSVGEDKGSLVVLTLLNYPLPFRGQDGREAAPHCSCGHGIPASRLCS